mmetsp:Transcript_83314/g.131527  ORF Transcript_83314/g.131527 Transcript_83314/m.131527 type:complete len:207 (+) Transcript_83314:354-974(+)
MSWDEMATVKRRLRSTSFEEPRFPFPELSWQRVAKWWPLKSFRATSAPTVSLPSICSSSDESLASTSLSSVVCDQKDGRRLGSLDAAAGAGSPLSTLSTLSLPASKVAARLFLKALFAGCDPAELCVLLRRIAFLGLPSSGGLVEGGLAMRSSTASVVSASDVRRSNAACERTCDLVAASTVLVEEAFVEPSSEDSFKGFDTFSSL